MEPATIAAQLREISVYFELEGDKHRALAYDRAAKSIEAAAGLHRLLEEGRLEELPGVGPSIARVVGDLARRGNTAVLERLRAQWPAILVELAQLPKVGAQKARKLHAAIAPADLEAVAAACRAGLVRDLAGFGAVSEQKILQAIEERHLRGTRILLVDATDQARSLALHLRASDAADRVEIAGPVRGALEIVEHLAFAVSSEQPGAVVDRLASFALVTSVDRSAMPVVAFLAGGLRAEVWIAPPLRFGWAYVQATGSPAHVAGLRARAADRGLDLDRLDARDEALVYRAVALPWLPPEVRDGTDELAAAAAGDDFSDLVTEEDLTCAVHCHTTYSDGRNTIAEMAQAAAERGFQAITITDHSANAGYAGGLTAERLRAQRAEIDELRASAPVRLLHGTEADILADGALDVPPEVLAELDLVIASVHQRYKLDEDAMTARLVAAMRQPHFKIWGHALGRLVLRRDPIPVRLDEILDAAAENGRCAIEINGDPYRLDMDPVSARRAVARGLPFVLSSDAHSTTGLAASRWAVAMARRARIRKHHVLNTLPPADLADRLAPRPG